MSYQDAYIVAARRSAVGRVGGLHGRRRIEDLAAPVVRAVLADAEINPAVVDAIVLGNATESSNPARLIALAAGLPETAAAMTIDRQCASGLDAVVAACRTIGSGEAEVIVAGGAEALSTAPWRVAKPKHLHQLPRFLGVEPVTADPSGEPMQFEASERLAAEQGISREEQDAVALRSHLAALAARDAKRFVGEIVPLRNSPDEARDELVRDITLEDVADDMPYVAGSGTLTPSNTSSQADGTAFMTVVSPRVWKDLGQPKAMKLVAATSIGVAPDREALAAVAATQRLAGLHNDLDLKELVAIETSETSAAQLIAFARHFGIDVNGINTDGGAVARGAPFSASGAVLVVRLFSKLVRAHKTHDAAKALRGLAALSAIGGLGSAALFEAVG